MIYDVVEGTTEPQEMRLLKDREALSGTGFDIGIEFSDDVELTEEEVEAVEIEWLNQAAGTVSVTGLGALPVGSYGFRFTLTDSGDKVGYVPNGAARDTVRIVRV